MGSGLRALCLLWTSLAVSACGAERSVVDDELAPSSNDDCLDDGRACVAARCGDGVVGPGEECDPAAIEEGRGNRCRPDCTRRRCGDGILDPGEACDAGELNSDEPSSPCRKSCILPGCGDAILDAGEECDDGPQNSDTEPNHCRSTCKHPRCGDGTRDQGEACDEGAFNSDSASDACRADCRLARCGDGTVDSGEECDRGADNSNVVGSSCSPACQNRPETCGDGTVEADEQCDDANAISGDGCEPDCRFSRRPLWTLIDGQYAWPADIATDSEGNIFVVATALYTGGSPRDMLVAISRTGEHLETSLGPGHIGSIGVVDAAIAVDASDRLIVGTTILPNIYARRLTTRFSGLDWSLTAGSGSVNVERLASPLGRRRGVGLEKTMVR